MNTRKSLFVTSALVAASLASLALLADPIDPAEAPGAGMAVRHVEATTLELKKIDANEVHVVAEVIAVDPLAHSVRLREPTGVVDLRVQDPEQLKGVAVGDQVEATYTEGNAISVAVAPR